MSCSLFRRSVHKGFLQTFGGFRNCAVINKISQDMIRLWRLRVSRVNVVFVDSRLGDEYCADLNREKLPEDILNPRLALLNLGKIFRVWCQVNPHNIPGIPGQRTWLSLKTRVVRVGLKVVKGCSEGSFGKILRINRSCSRVTKVHRFRRTVQLTFISNRFICVKTEPGY